MIWDTTKLLNVIKIVIYIYVEYATHVKIILEEI